MNVNDPRWASIDAFVEENRDNILRDITRLVAVPSVEGAPEPGAPFGPGPKAALAKALEIADELGLDTFNADSYIGWAETGRIADGQKFLATITHTDVVPEGNGWDADPYTVKHPLPVRAEVPEGQRRGTEIPRACPAGCQRGDEHARRRLLRRALPDARLLLYAGRRVPGLQRREGRLQRRTRQPEV